MSRRASRSGIGLRALDRKEPNMMRRRRPLVPLAALVPVAALALVAAGCGGGSPRVASVASSTTTTAPASASASASASGGLLAFSHCMRSNGAPNFPDPQQVAGRDLKLTIHEAGAPSSQLHAAMRACSHLLPQSGGTGPQESAAQQRTRVADGLSFARCMRSHGVNRFPDPTAQGELTIEMVQGQGIDVHSPAVLQAVQACLPASHGALTPAKIRQALQNAAG
jgi:hypothetical protein